MINRLLRGLLAFTLLLGSTELFTQSNVHAAYATAFRVKETTTTTGTGTLNLGGAPSGYQTFVAGIGNANTCSYFIYDPTTGAWERGIGTVTDATPDTLARTTCLSNSSHTEPSKINFGAGTKYVYVHEGDAFTAGSLAQFASTTSAELATLLSDETGSSGGFVRAGSPTLTTPNLGTPSTLVLTNATGAVTATYTDDSVTYAKMQNVSATSRVLGRKTAGAGDTEELTFSEVLDFVGSAAQGDILYRNATAWVRLPAGTSGQYLQTQGAAANPQWATVSSSASDYIDPLALQNVGLSVTVGSSAITIALKQQDGSTDPSTGTAKCNIAFASSTATTGSTTMRSVTSALSLTVSNGSSLGFASTSATQRVWVGAIDNSGTVELCCWNSLNGTLLSLKRFNDGDIVTSTTEGGSGGADLAWTIYSTTGRTNKALRVLGYFEIQAAGSYAWNNSPTVVRVVQPGMPRTGDIVQTARSTDGAVATGTAVTPKDDTVPQSSEADVYMSQAITPRSALNLLEIDLQGQFGNSVNQMVTMSLFQDSTASALKSNYDLAGAANYPTCITLNHWMLAGTTSSTTFKLAAGGEVAGTTTFNGVGGARYYGGASNSFILVKEIFQCPKIVPLMAIHASGAHHSLDVFKGCLVAAPVLAQLELLEVQK